MHKIITISRQFGSGGHEIGKLLAERFEIPFYDKNILRLAEESSHYSEEYLLENEEQVPNLFSGSYYGGTHTTFYPAISTDRVFFSISNVLKDIAQKGPCVVVGRCADYVLQEYQPINFYIYASLASKVSRKLQLQKFNDGTTISESEMRKQILYVDKQRAKYYEFYTDQKWGLAENYHLCLNTTFLSPAQSVDILANYINTFEN